jgi:hypothetical protein
MTTGMTARKVARVAIYRPNDGEQPMTLKQASASCGVLALLIFASAAHAERWVQVDPENQHLWYDADSVRPAPNSFITLWMSAGSNRTVPGPDGKTIYPTLSLIDCRARTAGAKINFDLGEPLQLYDASSSMGELIAKLCSFQNTTFQ